MSTPNSAPVSIRAGSDADRAVCLEILNSAYQTDRFTDEWFRWKHEECPFGRSRLWLGEGPGGIEGLFMALPWRYRGPDGPVEGVRTVDGATLPAARGRGVLGALIAHEREAWNAADRPGILVATATEAARRSHVKNGALALPPLCYAYHLPGPRIFGRLEHGAHVRDALEPRSTVAMETDWTSQLLRWRTDPRSGHRYDAARLATADSNNGIVFRVTAKSGIRTVIPLVVWGSPATRARLLASVARSAGAPLVLCPTGPGAFPVTARAVRSAGHAWLCVWDRTVPPKEHARSRLGTLDGWRLGFGDLEGII